MSDMPNLPTGTVTFLFTDIEGSTKRWEHHAGAMKPAVERHDAILREAISAQGGHVFRTEGDAFRAVFATAPQALAAALQAQRALEVEPWAEEITPLRVRMALHTGAVEVRDGDYVGPSLNRMARLLSATHGGQTLLSLPTEQLVRDNLPPGVTLRDMGEHRLKDLIRPEHIYQVVAPDLHSEFPPLITLDTRPNNLPAQPTPLIGREKELADVERLLGREEVRLVTLTGPGGTGKTRLALQVGAELVGSFGDGVFFVNLAPITDPELVVSTIAVALGVKEAGGEPLVETLKAYLHSKRVLLLLDNFEQVVEAAGQVSQLLAGCQQLKIVVTSRVPLHVRGEREYLVPPLALPDTRQGHLPPLEMLTQYEAVKLFTERAQAVNPDFGVSDDNALSVAEICVRLDGLPLAIELAAARIRLLPPQAMLPRLQGYQSRLKLLTGGARDLPARQQTLRNTIEWSYDLLDSQEQRLFARLSVFSGGWTEEAAAAACGIEDTLEGLAQLLDKSLLRQMDSASDEPRFTMLGTIREYASERLAESGDPSTGSGHALADVQARHAAYYLSLAEAGEAVWFTAKQHYWLGRFDEEQYNFRAALTWALDNAPNLALRLSGALLHYWGARAYMTEGRRWLEEAIARIPRHEDGASASDRAARAKALFGAGVLATHQADYAHANELLAQSLGVARSLGIKEQTAYSLVGLSVVAHYRGEYDRAVVLLEESLPLFEDPRGSALVLNSLSNSVLCQGDYKRAASLAEQSLSLSREGGDSLGVGASLTNLGLATLEQGGIERAKAYLQESLALRQQLKDRGGMAHTLNILGRVAIMEGDVARASDLYAQSLVSRHEMGDREGLAAPLEGLAAAALTLGKLQRAARLYGAAQALREGIGAPMPPNDRAFHEWVASGKPRLDEAAWAGEWSAGRLMPMEQVVAYALEDTVDK